MTQDLNVLGLPLVACSLDPLTGFTRNGCCGDHPEDAGKHTVCVQMTAEFLAFSKAHGNDLSTPRPEWGFDGLKPGDRWCLCEARWIEALTAGKAPKVIMAATHESILEHVSLETLVSFSLDYSRH